MAAKAKKSSSGVTVKQVLLQKGERYGFYAAAGLLLFFLGFGVYVASTSASSTAITGEIAKNIDTAKQKMQAAGEDPPPIASEVFVPPTLADIKFTELVTPYPFFNPAEDANPKRISPKVLPPVESQVEVVLGATGAYELIRGEDGKT